MDLPEPVIDDVDVFGSLLKDGIGCKGNCALIVNENFEFGGELNRETPEEVLEPHGFLDAFKKSAILSLRC